MTANIGNEFQAYYMNGAITMPDGQSITRQSITSNAMNNLLGVYIIIYDLASGLKLPIASQKRFTAGEFYAAIATYQKSYNADLPDIKVLAGNLNKFLIELNRIMLSSIPIPKSPELEETFKYGLTAMRDMAGVYDKYASLFKGQDSEIEAVRKSPEYIRDITKGLEELIQRFYPPSILSSCAN